jgi:hypothetical protein
MPELSPSSAQSDPVPQIQQFILGELDHFAASFRVSGTASLTYYSQVQLKSEPFIGYLQADGPDGQECFLICRNYTPSELKPAHANCFFASYLSPIGQLVSSTAGERRTIVLPSRTSRTGKSVEFLIQQRDTFSPEMVNKRWDAIRNDISWIGGRRFVPSLRGFRPEEVFLRKREVADRVQLPDQAILDEVQDIIFREPLNRFLVVSGAPGTGKTTVLIKRLAQKTKYEFLTDEEKRLTSPDSWQENKNWVLFTPSDLLKNYLKESLGREHLPATDQTVRVWSQFRSDLLRDINFLKAGSNGYFGRTLPGQHLLKRPSNAEAVALTKAFRDELAEQLDRYYREEYSKFGERIRPILGEMRGGMQSLMEKALDYLTGAFQGTAQRTDPLKMGAELRAKAQQIDALCRYVEGLAARGEKKGGGTLTPDGVNQTLYETAQRMPKLMDIAVPEHLFPNLKPEIENLKKRVEALAEAVNISTVFARIPLFFHEFRSSQSVAARFYAEASSRLVGERKVDSMEMDALLWVALDLVTTHESVIRELERRGGRSSRAGYLLAQRQGMIAVDEATDFSAVELGCMRRLADPAFESFTVCGDPMQRLTSHGIQDWEDMTEMAGVHSSNILKKSYRQTARLLAVAMELYRNFMEKEPPFESAYPLDPNDPPPLAFRATAEDPAEVWITERIIEIWESNGQKLPSIGVFVPEGTEEARWVQRLSERLYENSINVEGSGNGLSLGNANRVRVFPVADIKGLEFEAAFFVDIDRMAEKAPTLIEKYLYVGLSRARSFLGTTYTTQFPRKLNCVRKHFADQRAFRGPSGE